MSDHTPEISIEEYAAERETGVTIDVRERAEYAQAHVPGAILMPMGQLASRLREIDRSARVHVICATGNRSRAMTDLLVAAGFDAASVTGGTSGWIQSGRAVGVGSVMSTLTVIPIETPTLGDRSYLVHDGEVAFVVDPQRDIDRVLALLEEHRVRLTHVFETHIHNDYVTGGFALAEHTGAHYLVNGEDEVSFDRTPLTDGRSSRWVTACASPRWPPPVTPSPTSPTP